MNAKELMSLLEEELLYIKLLGYRVLIDDMYNDIDLTIDEKDGYSINCFVMGDFHYFSLEDWDGSERKVASFTIEEFKKKLIEFF